MKISMKTKYGLRFMLNLGLNYGKGCVQLKEIADKEAIPIKFLEHVAHQVKLSGVIKVERGSKGGYFLARKPSEINLRQIVESLEGNLDFTTDNENETVSRVPRDSVLDRFWSALASHIKAYLESATLEDLVNSYRSSNKEVMYYI